MTIHEIIKKLNQNRINHNNKENLNLKEIQKYNQELKKLSEKLYKKTKKL